MMSSIEFTRGDGVRVTLSRLDLPAFHQDVVAIEAGWCGHGWGIVISTPDPGNRDGKRDHTTLMFEELKDLQTFVDMLNGLMQRLRRDGKTHE